MARARDQKKSRKRSLPNGGRRRKAGKGCLGVFAVVWMGFVLVFDGVIGYGFWRTYDAKARFLPVQGVVTSSQVEHHSSSDGTTYSARVEYVYEVGGRAYENDRHSYFSISTSSYKRADTIVRRYPAGQPVTVYYDPGEPGESVLEVDARSFPMLTVLFLTPFHCIGLGLLVGAAVELRGRRAGEDAAIRAYVVRRGDRTLVLEDAHWRGWAVFFMVLGVTSFIAVFVVAFGVGVGASRSVVLWTWSGCFGLAIVWPSLLRLRRLGRHRRLTIDWRAGRFTRRPDSVNIELGDVRTIRLVTLGTNTKVNGRDWYKHEISAVDADGDERLLLVVTGYRDRGEAVRDWFAEKFAVPATGGVRDEEAAVRMPAVSEVEINRTES